MSLWQPSHLIFHEGRGVLGYCDCPLAFGFLHLAASVRALEASSLTTGHSAARRRWPQYWHVTQDAGVPDSRPAEGSHRFFPSLRPVWALHAPAGDQKPKASCSQALGLPRGEARRHLLVHTPRTAAQACRGLSGWERTGTTLVCRPWSHWPPAQEPAVGLSAAGAAGGLDTVARGRAFPTGLAPRQAPWPLSQACWPPGDPVLGLSLRAEGNYRRQWGPEPTRWERH